ncbi:MAG: hypothetical protein CMH30_04645 [Micavibrio sp.]|nr:hypothetical protein [Micavibrio sp.]|tara:strand:- start:685 stop:909 length:225 start_codon:yes stop_codon:yes gene_type:complete
MASLNYNNLQTIQNITFEDFKDEYLAGNKIAGAYYAELEAQASLAGLSNVVSYAQLAQQVPKVQDIIVIVSMKV